MEYLVESALLTHGLKSVSNETIKKEYDIPTIGLFLCRGKNRLTVDWS